MLHETFYSNWRASDFLLAEKQSSAKKLSKTLESEVGHAVKVVEVFELSKIQEVKRERGKA